jgi:hypothetical protein
MRRLLDKFGKLITASFFIMGIGIVTFLLVIPLYGYFGIDTDVLGLLIFVAGLVVLIAGIIHRKKLRGWKLIILSILAAILSLPVLFLIAGLIYYVFTGKPLG